MSDDPPEPLLTLAREAVSALKDAGIDTASLRATALYRSDRDSIITGLPSYSAARQTLTDAPLVVERYGTEEGDRLALQFVYNLFPRDGATGLTGDVRRVWRPASA